MTKLEKNAAARKLKAIALFLSDVYVDSSEVERLLDHAADTIHKAVAKLKEESQLVRAEVKEAV